MSRSQPICDDHFCLALIKSSELLLVISYGIECPELESDHLKKTIIR